MEALTGVLETLKINSTIWIQLACFIVSYLALSNLIFKPYYAALQKRRENTVGGAEHAEKIAQQTQSLTSEYEAKAKEINAEFKTIYDGERGEAAKVYEQKVAAARLETQKKSEELRQEISVQVDKARQEMGREVPAISAAMASKLIGKEITQ